MTPHWRLLEKKSGSVEMKDEPEVVERKEADDKEVKRQGKKSKRQKNGES